MANDVVINVKADDKASGVLGGIGKSLHGLTSPLGVVTGAIGGMTSALGAIGLASIGIGAVGRAFGGLASDAIEAQKVSTQTDQVLRSTAGAAGVTRDMVDALASSLSKMTPFEDEAVQRAENMLLTFTSIGKDVFPTALKTVLDMSQALGQDLKSSSIQLGKALNDPITGMTALRRVGVQFTDAQEEMVKKLVESGDLMGAQNLILKELQIEFGGSARAAGETFAGKMAILNTQIGNVKEAIGGALLPVVGVLAGRLTDLISGEFFLEGAARMGAFVAQGIEAFGGFVSLVAGKVIPLVKTAWGEVSKLFTLFEDGSVSVNSSATGILALLNPLGALAREILPALMPLFKALLNTLIEIASSVGPAVANYYRELGKILREGLAKLLPEILPMLQGLLTAFSELAGRVLPLVVQGMTILITTILPPLIDLLAKAVNWLSQNEMAMKVVTIALVAVLAAMNPIPAAIIAIGAVVAIVTQNWDEIVAAIERFRDKVMAIPVLGAVIQAVAETFRSRINAIIDLFNNLKTIATNVIEFFRNIFAGNWSAAWENLKTIAIAALKYLLDYMHIILPPGVEVAWNLVKDKVTGALGAIGGALETFVVDKVGGFITSWAKKLAGFIAENVDIFVAAWSERLGKVADALDTFIIGPITSFVSGMVGKLVGFIDNPLTKFVGDFLAKIAGLGIDLLTKLAEIAGNVIIAGAEIGVNILGGLVGALADLVFKMAAFGADLMAKIFGIAALAFNWALDIGEAIVNGIWEAIKAAASWIGAAVGNWVKNNIVDPMKNAASWILGRSPSEFGKAIITGLTSAFAELGPEVWRQAHNFAQELNRQIADGMSQDDARIVVNNFLRSIMDTMVSSGASAATIAAFAEQANKIMDAFKVGLTAPSEWEEIKADVTGALQNLAGNSDWQEVAFDTGKALARKVGDGWEEVSAEFKLPSSTVNKSTGDLLKSIPDTQRIEAGKAGAELSFIFGKFYAEGLKQIWGSFVQPTLDYVLRASNDLLSPWAQFLGRDIGWTWSMSVAQGIESGKDSIVGAAVRVVLEAIAAARAASQTASPSKLWMGLGKQWMEGLGQGIMGGYSQHVAPLVGAATKFGAAMYQVSGASATAPVNSRIVNVGPITITINGSADGPTVRQAARDGVWQALRQTGAVQ